MFLAWFQSLCNKFPSIYFYIFRFFCSSPLIVADNRFFYVKLTQTYENASSVACAVVMFIDSIIEHAICVWVRVCKRIIEVVERFVLCVGCTGREIPLNIHNQLIDVHEMFYGLLLFSSSLYPSPLDRMPQLMTMNDVDWFFFLLPFPSCFFFGSCNFIKMLSVKRGNTLFTHSFAAHFFLQVWYLSEW